MMKIVDLLEHMANMKRQFRNTRLFIFEDWLLEHGELQGPVVRIDNQPMGKPKYCFQNAFEAVAHGRVDPDEWFYTEGEMVLPDIPVLIHHAWLSNRKGEVLEVTIPEDGLERQYFGVPFKPEFAVEQTLSNSFYSLYSDGVAYQELVQQPLPAEVRAWEKKREEENGEGV